jgi:hypothetical protein
MSTEKRQRTRTTRGRRTRRGRAGSELYKSSTPDSHTSTAIAAREHYHREKARRAGRSRPHDHPMEQARRAYQALLESDAAKAKGGRPRKTAPRKIDTVAEPLDDDMEQE